MKETTIKVHNLDTEQIWEFSGYTTLWYALAYANADMEGVLEEFLDLPRIRKTYLFRILPYHNGALSRFLWLGECGVLLDERDRSYSDYLVGKYVDGGRA